MSIQAQVQYNGMHYNLKYPDFCPICNKSIYLDKNLCYSENNSRILDLVFLCPNSDCQSIFIAHYHNTDSGLKIHSFSPRIVEIKSISEIIKGISPKFFQIFSEAEKANQLGFEQISGPGYRKALEFLIKDYAISFSSEEECEKIKKSFVGDVVKKFIKDPRIQSIAEVALWLGNDETHYLKIWQDKDISDFKLLIDLTIHWIEIEVLSNDYLKQMKNKNSV